MAHLYHVTLGNLSYCPPGDVNCTGGPQSGWGLINTGGFHSVQSYYYWSGTEYAPNSDVAWYFGTFGGNQDYGGKVDGLYAMAVRPGDVAAVPEPQTYAMLLLGLGAVLLVVRRRPH